MRAHNHPTRLPGSPLEFLFFVALGSLLISFAAWLTHVVVSIRSGEWLFLIAGAIAFPVGVVHGIGIWLRLL